MSAIIPQFTEEEFESEIMQRIDALGIRSGTRLLKVDLLEGNGLQFDDRGDIVGYYNAVPAALVGMGDVTRAENLSNDFQDYTNTQRLHIWISAYEKTRHSHEQSDIKAIRRRIRREVCGNNPYKNGNRPAQVRFISDQQIISDVNKHVVIYEQIYEVIYREFGIESGGA